MMIIDTTEDEDPRIDAMREAVKDDLFLADLAAAMEDFRDADQEGWEAGLTNAPGRAQK
jgi:hypothetical protein